MNWWMLPASGIVLVVDDVKNQVRASDDKFGFIRTNLLDLAAMRGRVSVPVALRERRRRGNDQQRRKRCFDKLHSDSDHEHGFASASLVDRR